MINLGNAIRIKSILRALKYRNYRLFFIGQGVSFIGTWIQRIAMGWLVYRLTNSKFLLGVVDFSSQIPSFLLTPVTGVIADSSNRRKLIIVTQTLAMLQALLLAILALTHIISISHIIILSAFLGLVNALDTPLRQSFLVEIVERKEDLGSAIALNSTMFNSARLIGPSIAGIIIAAVGEGVCFLLNSLSFLAVILALMEMKVKPHSPKTHKRQFILHIKEGFSYTFGFLPIRAVLLLVGLVSLMGLPYLVLMPVFARDVLHGGPHTMGFLMAAVGVGAFTASLVCASRRNLPDLERVIALAPGIAGAALIVFSLSRTLWLSLLMLTIVGYHFLSQFVSSNTLIQTLVDEDKRGRVMSIYTMALVGMSPIGSLIAGAIASKIGAPNTLALGGLSCILGSLIFTSKLPDIHRQIYPRYIKLGLLPTRVKKK